MERSGFTLVEVLVAIVILTVGILSTVATSMLVARTIAQSSHATRVAELAWSQSERMRQGTRCVVASGVASRSPFEIVWSKTPRGSTVLVEITVRTLPGPLPTRSETFVMAAPCR